METCFFNGNERKMLLQSSREATDLAGFGGFAVPVGGFVVAVAACVGLGLAVAVAAGVGLGLVVAVAAAVGLSLAVAIAAGVGLGLAVAVDAGVGLGLVVAVAAAVGLSLAVAIAAGVGLGLAVAVAAGVAVAVASRLPLLLLLVAVVGQLATAARNGGGMRRTEAINLRSASAISLSLRRASAAISA